MEDVGKESQSHRRWRNVNVTTTVPDQSRVGGTWDQMGPEFPEPSSVSRAGGAGAFVH